MRKIIVQARTNFEPTCQRPAGVPHGRPHKDGHRSSPLAASRTLGKRHHELPAAAQAPRPSAGRGHRLERLRPDLSYQAPPMRSTRTPCPSFRLRPASARIRDYAMRTFPTAGQLRSNWPPVGRRNWPPTPTLALSVAFALVGMTGLDLRHVSALVVRAWLGPAWPAGVTT
jgi:hypothetical protein